MSQNPYNPLDKISLAQSIAGEILSRSPVPLGDLGAIQGAGVYMIYYAGDFAPYRPARNSKNSLRAPIYVGKAIPKGGRKGGLRIDAAASGTALVTRLRQHATSIDEATNLKLTDFWVRHLVD